jgi:hypothetical protein
MSHIYSIGGLKMTNKVHKLVEKKTLGYRYTTIDKVIFESNNESGKLIVDDISSVIELDLTPKTIEMLYEFFRYLKTDLEV